MKRDGGYGVLEAGDLDGLDRVNQKFDEVEILDSRVSTFSYRDSAYNGALLVMTGKDIPRSIEEELEGELAAAAEEVEDGSLSLRYEGEDADSRYYSICDLTGAF